VRSPGMTSGAVYSVHVRYRLSSVRLSVVCVSVTFVRPTQAIEIFGNVSTQWYTGHLLTSRCRRKESSRSLSNLMMGFLYYKMKDYISAKKRCQKRLERVLQPVWDKGEDTGTGWLRPLPAPLNLTVAAVSPSRGDKSKRI